jgi:D-aminoacyl-tRNA deacylase
VYSIHRYLYSNPEPYVEFLMWGVDTKMTCTDEYFPANSLPGDIIIFASRHRSQSARPALLCHTPGNWGDDVSVGGKPNRIAKGSGLLLYYFYIHLTKFVQTRGFEFPVDQEVTHHGPTELHQPLGFIELGSSEPEWHNQEGGAIVADALIQTGKDLGLHHFIPDKGWDKKHIKICVGFGGTHYMPNFTRLIPLGYSFAHVVPKYNIQTISADTIKMIQNRVLEPIDAWVVDWKGLNSAEKAHLIPLLEVTNIPIKKTKELELKL